MKLGVNKLILFHNVCFHLCYAHEMLYANNGFIFSLGCKLLHLILDLSCFFCLSIYVINVLKDVMNAD